MLDANTGRLEIAAGDLTIPEAAPRSFRHFLGLGIQHILTGYDIFSSCSVCCSRGSASSWR
jgi:hypothetical protein